MSSSIENIRDRLDFLAEAVERASELGMYGLVLSLQPTIEEYKFYLAQLMLEEDQEVLVDEY